jgi:hypothetical protein
MPLFFSIVLSKMPPIRKPLNTKNNSTPRLARGAKTLKKCPAKTPKMAIALSKSSPKFLSILVIVIPMVLIKN